MIDIAANSMGGFFVSSVSGNMDKVPDFIRAWSLASRARERNQYVRNTVLGLRRGMYAQQLLREPDRGPIRGFISPRQGPTTDDIVRVARITSRIMRPVRGT